MVLKIRLVKQGTKLRPTYDIVVASIRKRLRARPIEKLGHFEPHPNPQDKTKHTQLNFDRTKYWIGVGAQPTPTVNKLLARAGIIPPAPLNISPDFVPKSLSASGSTPSS
ncbi:hypothetical protein BB561_005999 [Smittium simulii]|uniref:Ribosomal protein S16 n=1 Tax=Smittium simulii TaxID=133385 RepID=A0A2T9Y757_9FUNG|nr:hypothetical protein BB561_005999 [Smittium simulii]